MATTVESSGTFFYLMATFMVNFTKRLFSGFLSRMFFIYRFFAGESRPSRAALHGVLHPRVLLVVYQSMLGDIRLWVGPRICILSSCETATDPTLNLSIAATVGGKATGKSGGHADAEARRSVLTALPCATLVTCV